MDAPWTATDDELLLAAGDAQRALNQTFADMLPILAEIDTRGLPTARGFRDLADLLRTVQNVSRSTATTRARAADTLVPTRGLSGEPLPVALPAVAAAVEEAAISEAHVRVIHTTLAALPPHLGEHAPALERDLAGYARTMDPDALAKIGKKALAVLDPDGPRPRDPQPTRTRLTLRPLGNGFEARGWFDTESAATLRTALSPLSAPVTPVTICPDCRDTAAHPDGPVPGVLGRAFRRPDPVHTGLNDVGLNGNADTGPTDIGHTSAGRTGIEHADSDVVDAPTVRASQDDDAPTCPACAALTEQAAEAGDRDPRSTAERLGDGLVEMARRMMVAGQVGVEAGIRPHVTVTVPLETLESRIGAGLLGLGDGTLPAVIDAETARRYACDATLTPIVLGGAGEPLDVGREHRLATRAMRRALAQRDGGCAFPGCHCPPQWCHAHHIQHWADGGTTEITNLVLLCSRHHTVIHHQDWTTTAPDGIPQFHPPDWIPGGPRRNLLHRPDLTARAVIPRPRPPVRIAHDLDAEPAPR